MASIYHQCISIVDDNVSFSTGAYVRLQFKLISDAFINIL